MDRYKGQSSKNQSKKNSTVEDICNLVKKRGLFDKIRKEVFKDAENSPDLERLKSRVRDYVESFTANVRWHPGLNRSKLREELKQELMKSKTLSRGVDNIIRDHLRPTVNKYRKDHDKIACEVFDVTFEDFESRDKYFTEYERNQIGEPYYTPNTTAHPPPSLRGPPSATNTPVNLSPGAAIHPIPQQNVFPSPPSIPRMPSNIIPNMGWSNQPPCPPVVLPPPEDIGPNIKPPLPPLPPPSPPKPDTPPPPPEQPPAPPVEEETIYEQMETQIISSFENKLPDHIKLEDNLIETPKTENLGVSHEDVDMDIDTDEEKPLIMPDIPKEDVAKDDEKQKEEKISPWKNQVAQFEDLQLSDVTVSSVHTSDISLTSSDDDKDVEKTKTPEQKKEKKEKKKRKKQETVAERHCRPQRKRIVNRKYASKDFSSFYNELENTDSDADNKVTSTSSKDKKPQKQSPYSSSTPSPYYVAEEQAEAAPKKLERTTKNPEVDTPKEEKPAREPSPNPKGSSKRYDSSDLYKPRTSLRRSRRQSSPKFDDTDVYAPYRGSERAKSNNKTVSRRSSSKSESKKSNINTPDSPVANEPTESSTAIKTRLGQRSSGIPTDPRKKAKEKVYESVSEGELIDDDDEKDIRKEKKTQKVTKPPRRKSEEEEGEITDGSLSSISLDPI
ncbi:DgyrCDS10875 [Dimorphilus gyrociliatus]|uniref:DgyrCDS10875 n=1 Tax=Dimorphilus gyrociliatus TaxID=2664684 RepID=A0A7I8W3J7_9ANNE|nr:DgyrCDS10875 [Dimorphilus gyrociliatus]